MTDLRSRERAREVLASLDIPVDASDAHGIWISRTICPGGVLSLMETERWRLYTGGGIAGNSDKIWLAPKVRRAPGRGAETYESRGPYTSKSQLEKALRAWRRGE